MACTLGGLGSFGTWVGSGERSIFGLRHSKTEEDQDAGHDAPTPGRADTQQTHTKTLIQTAAAVQITDTFFIMFDTNTIFKIFSLKTNCIKKENDFFKVNYE